MKKHHKTTHGHSSPPSPTYTSWKAMRERCTNEEHARYQDYGGRGIDYCEAWEDFEAFLADMGERPKGTTLDRINSDGMYEPTNCRWATSKQQYNNRRSSKLITLGGETKSYAEWADLKGLHPNLVGVRIRMGWTPERAVMTPSRQGHA